MPQKIKLFYLRNEQGHPVACVASTPIDTDTDLASDTATIGFAVSTQNPLDNFDRKRGRTIAIARLSSSHLVGEVEGGLGVKRRVVTLLARTKSVPQRTREAAQYWLTTHPETAPATA